MRPRLPHEIDHGFGERRSWLLELDDDRGLGIPGEHFPKGRDVKPGELLRRACVDQSSPTSRTIQEIVVMDDNHAVAREMDIELDAVGPGGQPAVECDDGVLGPELAAAAVGKDQRPGGVKDPVHRAILAGIESP